MFIESPKFPACPSFGYTAQPDLSVTVIATASGREKRNRNWEYPKTTFSCVVGPRDEDSVQEVRDFFLAMGAEECGFRFQDYQDYKSCFVSDTPEDTDQPILLDDTVSPPEYYLAKEYVAGPRALIRRIIKPVTGTILVSDAGVLKTEGAGAGHYSIDYTTGIVTLHFTPTGQLRWGGEYDVPVRFNSQLPVQIVDKEIMSVQFSMIEILDPSADDEGSP